jgi:stage II sporulation protein AA (anti-sigma F factor antagonist)
MASPDPCFSRAVPGNRTADPADRRLVSPDLDGQAGTPVESTPTPFEVRRVDHPLGVVLVLRGELDLATVPLLEDHLNRTMRSGASVVIDLAGLGFIDSTGLEVLLRADRQLRAADGQLVLLSGSPAVYRVFELAGMDVYFEWSDAPTAQTAPEPDGELEGTMS